MLRLKNSLSCSTSTNEQPVEMPPKTAKKKGNPQVWPNRDDYVRSSLRRRFLVRFISFLYFFFFILSFRCRLTLMA